MMQLLLPFHIKLFKEMGAVGLHAIGKEKYVPYDIKDILDSDDVDGSSMINESCSCLQKLDDSGVRVVSELYI